MHPIDARAGDASSSDPEPDLAGLTAPSLADFERLAAEAWDRLPGEFRALCGDLVIRVEDFAIDEVLDALGIEDAFDLMGLYQGVSLDKKSVLDIAREPDMVFLYRRAILDYWVESGESLGHIVAHVLIHEIGHHFGLSDADMEAIEEAADREAGPQ
ncbi:MAG: metallopeptidase family protein [Hyphomicrobiaceae bacterium]|nr:metallopeptidase family protein [Hyphomicrobiaceae bacterium]